MLLSGMQPSRAARRPALPSQPARKRLEERPRRSLATPFGRVSELCSGARSNPGGDAESARDPQRRGATRPAEMNSSFCIEAPPRSRVATEGTERGPRSQPRRDCPRTGSVPINEPRRDCPRTGTVPINGCWDRPLRGQSLGGRSTANSSVTSSRGERKRKTAAGRPPPRPGVRRSPVASMTPRRSRTRWRFVADTSCPSAAA